MEEEQDINPYNLLDKITNLLEKVEGIDLVYFLDSSFQIIKKSSNNGKATYFDQVLNIISAAGNFYTTDGSKPSQMYTLLNEEGLIVISKLDILGGLYMVVIGGENEPVDLINLLKLVKEVPKKLVSN